MFLEQVRDPKKFIAVLELANERETPVVVLKVGRTARSAAMAVTHTGALAGNDQAFVAMCRRYGVVIVDDLDEMAATLAFFDQDRRLAKGSLSSLHDSGGQRELAVDIAESVGVDFAEISESTRAAIVPYLDEGLVAENPLDAYGTPRDFVARFEKVIKAFIADENVSCCVFFSDIRDDYWYSDGVVEAIRRAGKETSKPIAIATNYSQTFNAKSAMALASEGIPLLEGTREALLAIRHASEWRDRRRDAATHKTACDKSTVEKWREKLKKQGTLAEHEGLQMLRDFAIATVSNQIANSVEEACLAAGRIGYPVALKTAEGHAHKSEVGGVHLGLKDEAAVRNAYQDIETRLGSRVLVSAMAPSGIELGLGAVVDKAFGPMVVVSAGGVLIEYLDDVASALAPVSQKEAVDLLSRLKLSRILRGVRGKPSADLDALSDVIARFSQMVAVLAENISEIDVNPIIAGSSSASCVDALVIGRQVETNHGS
jgi:acyl-CoA synthetase (NDP forming)